MSIFTLSLSSGIKSRRPVPAASGHFYVPDVKTAENEKSWSDKPLAAPIATSEIVLLYVLSYLTKRSDKSFDSALFISWQIFCLPFDLP